MSNRQVRFVRLNLAQHWVTSLTFSWTIEWAEQVSALFAPLLGEQGEFLSGTIYSRQKKPHAITIWASRLDAEGSERLQVAVAYNTGPHVAKWEIPREYRREEEFFQQVRQLPESIEVQCLVHFGFDEDAGNNLWFPLPTRLGGDPGATALYELRGVQGVRLSRDEEDHEEYAFHLSRPRNRSVFLDITFSRRDSIDDRLPEHIVLHASKLATELVRTGS